MELYIGGFAQGKLNYVLRRYSDKTATVWDGARDLENGTEPECFFSSRSGTKEPELRVLNHFHLWVKEMLLQEKDAETIAESFVQAYPDCIVISDEIGNGIVPLERAERDYRERLGRILIGLADRAERVERIICGMGQRLK